AGVPRVARQREPLDARQVDHAADLRSRRGERGPDREARIGMDGRDRDDHRRRVRRLDVYADAEDPAADDVAGEPDAGAVHGRVNVRPGRGADVERGRRRARAAAELVVDDPRVAAAEDAMEEVAQEPFVAAPADGLETDGAVAGRVVADR